MVTLPWPVSVAASFPCCFCGCLCGVCVLLFPVLLPRVRTSSLGNSPLACFRGCFFFPVVSVVVCVASACCCFRSVFGCLVFVWFGNGVGVCLVEVWISGFSRMRMVACICAQFQADPCALQAQLSFVL